MISGQVQTEDGEPVANISYEVNFPFAVVETVRFTSNQNGFFSVDFQVKPDLAFPQEAQITFTNLLSNLVDVALDVSVAQPIEDRFSLSVPNEIFWDESQNTLLISGAAPSGSAVNIEIPEIGLADTLTATAVNSYSLTVVIPQTFTGGTLTTTASTADFDPETLVTVVRRNGHDPSLNFDEFQFN